MSFECGDELCKGCPRICAHETTVSGFRSQRIPRRPRAPTRARAFLERWPEFIFHDPVPKELMPTVHRYFGEVDILVLDDGKVVAGGWGVPFALARVTDDDDLPEGYDAALARAVDDYDADRSPNAFSFMAAAVHRDHDKRGLAQQVLTALTQRARTPGGSLGSSRRCGPPGSTGIRRSR